MKLYYFSWFIKASTVPCSFSIAQCSSFSNTVCFSLKQITVSDDGHPPKSTVVHVIVNVLDENDNSPQFLEKIFQIKLVEQPEAVEPKPVYRMIAYDRDESPSSDISYTIEESEKHGTFFIEPKSGIVFSKEAFSAGEYHILTVCSFQFSKWCWRSWWCIPDVFICSQWWLVLRSYSDWIGMSERSVRRNTINTDQNFIVFKKTSHIQETFIKNKINNTCATIF